MDERGNGRHYHAKQVVNVLLIIKEVAIFQSILVEICIRTNRSLFFKSLESINKL